MDHLSSREERKARWYSKVRPRFLQIVPAQKRQDFLNDTNDNSRSIPYTWFQKDDIDDTFSITDLLHTCLRKDGFVVISGVLSDDECQAALIQAWDWLEAASRAEHNLQGSETQPTGPMIDRNDMTTLRTGVFPTSLEGGILPFYGSGHSTAAWTIRSHPSIRAVFRTLFQTDDLIASLDGMVLWHSHQMLTDFGWFHIDQNPREKPGLCSYQGLLNLLPVTPSTGGNVVVRGSHNLFPDHYLNHPDSNCREFYNIRLDELNGDDWMEIDPNDHTAIHPQKVISLLLKPGDFLLWDSRTIHCSHPPSTTPFASLSPQLVRAATLVTMMPTSWANSEVRQKRQEAVQRQRTLSHWANRVAPLGAECDEQVQLEAARVDFIRQWQEATQQVILCDWDDLNPYQQSLVVGKKL
ncbi:hypothetical protein FisN_5Hh101 [Fistulifera solaris]|uniref:Phytanoyl-CoA dioxygenase n=1 Tax=Fistulifera solaris TaxID=1519565 RepID=A0A1Z5JTU2_FISSO|nr:hypothetical protein FisN_5Hh101 [Fistulifera solaris]|eukprot:GAX17453.1 hypothetical protein FisN_5Hh101 [Fistulifera solaris]